MPSEEDIPFIDPKRLKWSEDSHHLLGEGSFGKVYRGRYTGSPAAIKILKRPNISDNYSEDYQEAETAAMKQHRREIRRFKDIRHGNIIQFYAVFRDQDPRDLYIVTEYLQGGSLHSSLTKMRARNAVLDIQSSLKIALDIAYGLNYVHVENYTHGDMKPHNVLLTSEFNFIQQQDGTQLASFAPSAKAKIADFGLSKRLTSSNSFQLNATTIAFGDGPCGTYLYMSPEAYNGVNSLSDDEAKASDVYSFGLVLFELFSGMLSWRLEGVRNPIQLHKLVSSGQRPSWGPRQNEIDPRYIDLVSQCWSHNPNDRPPLQHIVYTLEIYAHEIAGGFISKTSYLPMFGLSPTVQEQAASSASQNVSSPNVEQPTTSQVQEEQTDNTITLNGSNDDLTGKDIYNVESKDLTDSQAKELLRKSTSQNSDSKDEDNADPPQWENSHEQHCPTNTDSDYIRRRSRVEDSDSYDDDSIENENSEERHEIDKTFIGDTKVRRVESSYIPPPSVSLLEISDAKNVERKTENGDEPLLGVGGGVDENKVNSMLDSFLNAAVRNDSDTEEPPETIPQSEQEGTSVSHNHYTSAEHVLPPALPGRAPGFPEFPNNDDTPNDAQNTARMYPHISNNTPDYPSTQNTKNKSYSSPAVEIDINDLPELVENDRRALSEPGISIGPSSTEINDSATQLESNRVIASQAFDASSPTYSDPNLPGGLNIRNATNHSLIGLQMQPTHQTAHHIPTLGNNNHGSTTLVGPTPNHRPQVNQGMSIQFGIGSMNYNGIAPQYATSSHSQFGRHTNVRNGSSFSHDLSRAAGGGGEEELKRCRLSLCKNIEAGNGGDPNVAVKVCTEIGKIASSNPTRIRHSAVIDTLGDIVRVMYFYNQHPYSQGQVYAACNYALCNLLKVSNVIAKTDLRRNVASWIAYTIIWNITRDGSHLDSFVVPVGHTAAAAARNFMWTNEENVIAFVEQRGDGEPSRTSHLIKSLNFYCDRGDQIVVEATLAALTTLIYYPHQRTGFVQHRGIDVLIFVLEKYFFDSKMSILIFAELTVLFSGPSLGGGYLESLQHGLLVDKGIEKVIRVLWQVLDIDRNEKAKLETIEKGLESLLTISRFSSLLLHKVSETGSGPIMIRLLYDLSKNLSSKYVVGEQPSSAGSLRRTYVLIGKIVCALAEELGTISGWKEKFRVEISGLLDEIGAKPAADEALIDACKATSRVFAR